MVFLLKVSDIAEHLPQAVVFARINDRIQNSQINIKSVFANKPLLHLDVPNGTEKITKSMLLEERR